MPNSVRPWVTAGIVVVGVGALAVGPVQPIATRPDVQVASSSVDVDVARNPLTYYPQVVMRSLDNAGELISEYFSDPLPIVTAVARSQYFAMADVVAAVERGDVVAVVNAVIRAIGAPVVNLVKVAATGAPFEIAASLIVRLALPIVSGVMAAGSAMVDVAAALADFDFVGAVSAVTNMPARIVDGVLNGQVDATGDEYFGFLSPVLDAPVADQLTGPAAFALNSLAEIGATIAPPESSGPGGAPAVGATTITLPTVASADPPGTASGSEPPASGASEDPHRSTDDDPDPGEAGALPLDPALEDDPALDDPTLDDDVTDKPETPAEVDDDPSATPSGNEGPRESAGGDSSDGDGSDGDGSGGDDGTDDTDTGAHDAETPRKSAGTN